VTESFGLFEKRMNSLHKEYIEFMSNALSGRVNRIIFYPNLNSVGSESHRRLLLQYAETWTTTSEAIEKRLIIQAPYFEQEEKKRIFSNTVHREPSKYENT